MGISGTIWGLGIFLYNLLSGQYPIASEEDFDYAYLVLSPDVSQGELKQKHHKYNKAVKLA